MDKINDIPDESIDTSDIPELDDNFWEKAKLVEPITKKAISLRVDSDVLEWFKNQGKGYQSLMNSVLRSYVEHQIIIVTAKARLTPFEQGTSGHGKLSINDKAFLPYHLIQLFATQPLSLSPPAY